MTKNFDDLTDRQALDNLKIMNPERKPTPHDPKCYELARYFLEETPGDNSVDRAMLAGYIQQAIDDFFDELEAREDRENGYDPRNDPLDHDYEMNR